MFKINIGLMLMINKYLIQLFIVILCKVKIVVLAG